MTKLKQFPNCGTKPLGFYPIVDSSEWLARLLPLGVSTIQLRIKNKDLDWIESEIINSVAIAEKYSARLFINDYWQLAVKHNAYGVHLGQEDIRDCDIEALAHHVIRLGISTHSIAEMDTALNFSPSYVACGPVFPTTSKPMPYVPQGISQLKYWVDKLSIPLVAIGGINLERLDQVIASGVDGIAVISAVTQALDPETIVRQFLQKMQHC